MYFFLGFVSINDFLSASLARKTEGHPKTQTMQAADCRLQTVQTMQTVQTVQTENFFSNTWITFSLFSVLRLQNSVKYVVMFVIYPQTAQTRRLTVDSIDKRV